MQFSARAPNGPLAASVDLRHDGEIHDQGALQSCTAQAVVTLVEYCLRKAVGGHTDFSRLFLYKVTRNLLGIVGDQGATLRETIKAMALFGVPPERYHPYVAARFDDEPSAFLYSFAQSFKALDYVRLDPQGASGAEVLDAIRRSLAAGYPVAFGFTVFSSISYAADVPFPSMQDRPRGGHAVVIVGYDDEHRVNGESVPSLIIQNSWGELWGEKGVGYLPYRYVEAGLACDFWSILKQDWLDLPSFA